MTSFVYHTNGFISYKLCTVYLASTATLALDYICLRPLSFELGGQEGEIYLCSAIKTIAG